MPNDGNWICEKARSEYHRLYHTWVSNLLSQEDDNPGFILSHYDMNIRDLSWNLLMERIRSPIEQILATELLFMTDGYRDLHFLEGHTDIAAISWGAGFTPQVRIGTYTVDFFVTCTSEDHYRSLVNECDGHDFHEKTKEQAQHDKRRDRFLASRGLTVLRFTGSEIFRDPEKCAEEIRLVINNTLNEAMRDSGKLARQACA